MNKNILWLAGWYPNAFSPLEGDFIQRHARAASLINDITVVFVKKDDKGTITKNIKTEKVSTANLKEITVYYHPIKTGIKLFDRFLSWKKYNSIYRSTLKGLLQDKKFDLLHVHVALKIAKVALWLKEEYSIPFIISEHWTAYLPEAKPNIDNENAIDRSCLKKIFKNAATITVVSKVLGNAIKSRYNIKKYEVIPNVVDTNIFYPVQKQFDSLTKFIHVSVLNYQKNAGEIIEALSLVKNSGYNFQLIIYGPENKDLKMFIKNKNFKEQVIFKEEVPQDILAKDMQQADALILYSRYETFGCVVIEANACGIPAILSDLPVFREYIMENKTGVFAKPNDAQSLADTIIKFIQQKDSFTQSEIAALTKSKFGYEVVAKLFNEVYKSIIR